MSCEYSDEAFVLGHRFRNFYAGSRVGLEIPWLPRKPNVLTQFGLFGPVLAQFYACFSLGLLTPMSTFSSPTRGGSEAGANELTWVGLPALSAEDEWSERHGQNLRVSIAEPPAWSLGRTLQNEVRPVPTGFKPCRPLPTEPSSDNISKPLNVARLLDVHGQLIGYIAPDRSDTAFMALDLEQANPEGLSGQIN